MPFGLYIDRVRRDAAAAAGERGGAAVADAADGAEPFAAVEGAQLVLSLICNEEPFALGVSRIAERVRTVAG